jgi:hypothetical protein
MPLRPSQVETLRWVGRANKRGEALTPWALGEICGILTRSAEERLDRLAKCGYLAKGVPGLGSPVFNLTQLGREALATSVDSEGEG